MSTKGSSRAKFWTRLPEFIRKLIVAASVSGLDSEIPTERNEEYKVFLESPKQHNRSILANALSGGSRSLPLLVAQQLANSLYNGQLQGFKNHKPGSLLLFHTGQSDDLSEIMTQLDITIFLHGHIFPTTGHLLVICFCIHFAYFYFYNRVFTR